MQRPRQRHAKRAVVAIRIILWRVPPPSSVLLLRFVRAWGRCVVSRKGVAMDMSIDHKPEDEEELTRIEKAGGSVVDGRVQVSAPSRRYHPLLSRKWRDGLEREVEGGLKCQPEPVRVCALWAMTEVEKQGGVAKVRRSTRSTETRKVLLILA